MNDNAIDALRKRIIRKFIEFNNKRPEVPIISVVRLKKIIAEPDVILLDVRDQEEYRISRLPSAFTIDELYSNFSHIELMQKRIVVYCTIGERSGRFIQRNLSKGYKWYNLVGGVLSWSLEKGKFYTMDDSGKQIQTRNVHTYNKDWNLLSPFYNPVY